ncbi:MAG: c-type cytochrome, partial [Acidobacteriota bacterium]
MSTPTSRLGRPTWSGPICRLSKVCVLALALAVEASPLEAFSESGGVRPEELRPHPSHEPQGAPRPPQGGPDLYARACATCHGADGRGASRALVAFDDPLPDFTDCSFASREPDEDWL